MVVNDGKSDGSIQECIGDAILHPRQTPCIIVMEDNYNFHLVIIKFQLPDQNQSLSDKSPKGFTSAYNTRRIVYLNKHLSALLLSHFPSAFRAK